MRKLTANLLLLLYAIDLLAFKDGLITGFPLSYIYCAFLNIFFMCLIIHKGLPLISNKLVRCYFLFILYFLTASIFSIDPLTSFRYGMNIFLWFLTFMLFASLFRHYGFDRSDAMRLLHKINIITIIYIIISFIYTYLDRSDLGRLFGLFRNRGPNSISWYIVFSLFITAYLRTVKYKKYNFNFYPFVFVCVSALLYANSRSVYFSLFLLSIYAVISLRKDFYAKGILMYTLFLAAAFPVFIALALIFNNEWIIFNVVRYIDVAYSLLGLERTFFVDQIPFDNSIAQLTSNRGAMLFISYKFLSDSVGILIFGIGLEAYRIFHELLFDVLDGRNVTIHSVYLQYLVGGGIVGFAFFIFFLRSMYGCIRKIVFKHDLNFIHYLYLFVIFNLIFSPSILNRLVYFFMPILIILFTNLSKRRNTVTS